MGKAVARPPGRYMELVKKFPLVPIRDDAHLEEAFGVLDALLREELDEGGEAYLEVLTVLVGLYEKQHIKIGDASPADMLRDLMGQHKVTQSQLARSTGIAQSTISAVLNGERELTKGHVLKLANFFHLAPAAFLPRELTRGEKKAE